MGKKFFENSIKFECQGSSNCCVSRGTYGFVYLSSKDLKRLSKFFSISILQFVKIYCDRTDGYLHLKEINENGNCQFLKETKCSVYMSRPIACRTWPFWKENMNTKKWNKELINFCPGIGKGKLISSSMIQKIINRELKNDKQIIKDDKP